MNQQPDPEQARHMEEMKRELLAKILDKEAFERLGRVRIADPMLVAQVELYLIQLFQAGKIPERLTDAKLKELLQNIAEKKEFNIKRK